jgi:hypothetical protein
VWLLILWAIFREVPDWNHRIDFWLDVAKQAGGASGTIARIVQSGYFSLGLVVAAVAYLIFVGEPQAGVQRHRWWRYIGWGTAALVAGTTIWAAWWGYVEIYIREQVASRQATILHDGINPGAPRQEPDPSFSYVRRLSSDQFRMLAQQGTKLKPLSPLIVAIPPNDNEAWQLRRDITDALTRSGVTSEEQLVLPDGPEQVGIMIGVADPHNPPPEAEQLREVLVTIGIVPTYIANHAFSKAVIFLYVGPRSI